MDFVLGCNYWASNAGADMWRDFDADCVKNDIRILAEYGISIFVFFPTGVIFNRLCRFSMRKAA